MANALNLKPHVYKSITDPTTKMRAVRLVRVEPYLRLIAKGLPPVFVQKGRVMMEDGTDVPFSKIPAQHLRSLESADEKVLAEKYGFSLEQYREAASADAPESDNSDDPKEKPKKSYSRSNK